MQLKTLLKSSNLLSNLQHKNMSDSDVPGRVSALSRRCLVLSLDNKGLLLCGGGSGLDKQEAARPPPPPLLLHPSVNPPPASGHICLSLSCVSCWCQSGAAASALFRGSLSCFGEGVLSDGYGGSGLWAKISICTCRSVFLLPCLLSVPWLSTCKSVGLFSDHNLSICLPPIHCLSIFLSICRWVCLSTVHCLSKCLLSVQYLSGCRSIVLGSPGVLSCGLLSNRCLSACFSAGWSPCLASIHGLSGCRVSPALCLLSIQYLSDSDGCSNTASTSDFCQNMKRHENILYETKTEKLIWQVTLSVPLWEKRSGVCFLPCPGEGCPAQVADLKLEHFPPGDH